MQRIESLRTLLDHAESERDDALKAVQQAEAQAHAAAEQAEQLLTYRNDYQQRWTLQFQSAGSIEILRHYQSFSQRLGQAIEQQQRVAAHALTQVQRCRETLAECELRVASGRKLIERRVGELHHAAERRDQKHTDEAAQRAAWRARNDSRLAPLA